ncbi:MAG TPA: hypothetical protein VJ279_04080, partial [Hanamia sp.]|nr:hypothetical protein [Hanamia sp.]
LWQNGWTGIAQLFKENSIGVCSYKIENILVSKGAIQIDENTVRHDVNNKITTIDIAGSMNSGFIYTISWYDKTYFHDLECANLAFKPELKDKLIALAKKIDAGAF